MLRVVGGKPKKNWPRLLLLPTNVSRGTLQSQLQRLGKLPVETMFPFLHFFNQITYNIDYFLSIDDTVRTMKITPWGGRMVAQVIMVNSSLKLMIHAVIITSKVCQRLNVKRLMSTVGK